MDDRLHLLFAAVAGAGVWHACTTLRPSSGGGANSARPAKAQPTGAGKGTVMGLLHPGAMGASIGFNAKLNGARVVWAGNGRSRESFARAVKADLEDVGTLEQMVETCSLIVSVCPPAAALEVASSVAALKFSGTFVDANAVAPATAAKVAAIIREGGGTFVDGGIVGGPAWECGPKGPGTRLYLSGEGADGVARLFRGTNLGAEVVPPPPTGVPPGGTDTGASAMKIAYASWTKGSAALLINVNAYAKAAGVHDTLIKEWTMDEPHDALRRTEGSRGIGPKAWRWVGEMEEIASAFSALELSGDFHTGAAKVYDGLAHLKGTPPTKSAAEMAQELATKASQKLEVKQALRGPVDLDF